MYIIVYLFIMKMLVCTGQDSLICLHGTNFVLTPTWWLQFVHHNMTWIVYTISIASWYVFITSYQYTSIIYIIISIISTGYEPNKCLDCVSSPSRIIVNSSSTLTIVNIYLHLDFCTYIQFGPSLLLNTLSQVITTNIKCLPLLLRINW